jgi:hypothetical protein
MLPRRYHFQAVGNGESEQSDDTAEDGERPQTGRFHRYQGRAGILFDSGDEQGWASGDDDDHPGFVHRNNPHRLGNDGKIRQLDEPGAEWYDNARTSNYKLFGSRCWTGRLAVVFAPGILANTQATILPGVRPSSPLLPAPMPPFEPSSFRAGGFRDTNSLRSAREQ